jgi:hypothetical protein
MDLYKRWERREPWGEQRQCISQDIFAYLEICLYLNFWWPDETPV